MADATPPITMELIRRLVPFAEFLDVTFSVLQADRVVAHLPDRPGYGTIGGGVHGGAQMALADITAAVMAVLAGGDPTAGPATAQSSTNFLQPARGPLTATASVLRRGRSAVIDVLVADGSGATAAVVRQTVSVRAATDQSSR